MCTENKRWHHSPRSKKVYRVRKHVRPKFEKTRVLQEAIRGIAKQRKNGKNIANATSRTPVTRNHRSQSTKAPSGSSTKSTAASNSTELEDVNDVQAAAEGITGQLDHPQELLSDAVLYFLSRLYAPF